MLTAHRSGGHVPYPPLVPLTSVSNQPRRKSQSASASRSPSGAPLNGFLRVKSSSTPALSVFGMRAVGSDSDSDTEDTDEGVLYRRTTTLRTRIFGPNKADTISTAPGTRGAGETETELDEPPRHLPTARIVPVSAPIVPPSTLEQRLTPLLFELSRLLSIVPAVIGTIYNLYHLFFAPVPSRIDYFVSALWSILTGYQCLALTTGLLTRWRVYYPPLATLIRLLALQAICWPATHLSLTLLNAERRPAAVWAAIGTTTCMSRSVQIWVTSNLWWEPREGTGAPREGLAGGGGWRRFGGRWGGRRWDWREVGLQCMLPAGVLYFVMAWAEQLRREWDGC
ncbi:N-glycosylation protein-domain-containing protein [Roridomyces roridus]|uniref:N-glycosylation protein-domain-containing protein n=1 Tax=Roridomyces roridus TaxID=1738132 RepID=A0AAD7FWQ0_9AGAR|nr:N-glycosylation protein-domain-containing protein [Roridomyces roridus]